MCVYACMYVCVVCMCACVCVCCECVHMQSCVLQVCVCDVCICVQKRKRDKTITCFEVCTYTPQCVYAHVWGVHEYICSAETSLSS